MDGKKLNNRIIDSIKLLELKMQKYAFDFLIIPKEIEVFENFDQINKVKVFLVLDDPDNAYKIYYDEIEDKFGLISVLDNNNWCVMGLYGEFNVTLFSM